MIVARITLGDGREAELDETGIWSSSRDYLPAYLNTVYGKDRYPPTPSAPRCDVGNQAWAAAMNLPALLEWLVLESEGEVVY